MKWLNGIKVYLILFIVNIRIHQWRINDEFYVLPIRPWKKSPNISRPSRKWLRVPHSHLVAAGLFLKPSIGPRDGATNFTEGVLWPSSASPDEMTQVESRWLFHPEFPDFGTKTHHFRHEFNFKLQDRLVSIMKDRGSTSILLFYWANCPRPKKCHSLTHPLIHRAQPSDRPPKPWTTPPNRRRAWPPECPGVESAPPPDGGAKLVI